MLRAWWSVDNVVSDHADIEAAIVRKTVDAILHVIHNPNKPILAREITPCHAFQKFVI